MPGWKQAWPISAACWSPAMPSTGIAAPSSDGSLTPNSAAQSSTSGSRLRGISNSASNSSSQSWLWMLNSRVREALVASVRWERPPVRRQSRKQSTVPKRSSPRSAALAGAGHVVEDPAQLGGGEIRIDQQPGARADIGLVAGGLEFGTVVGGTTILPDDGRVDQVAAGGVPDQRGLALVGDADGGDVGRAQALAGERVATDLEGGQPDFLAVVLHPAVPSGSTA